MSVVRRTNEKVNRKALTFTANPYAASSASEVRDFIQSSVIYFDTIATTNITLSGFQTIDEVTGADGVRVLVNGQSDQNQNGGYIMRSGAWERVSDVMFRGVPCVITQGNAYKDSIYVQNRPVSQPDGSSSAWYRRRDNGSVQVSAIVASSVVMQVLGSTNASDIRYYIGLGTAAVLDAGTADGVATLDSSGKVPVSQLPTLSYGNMYGSNNLSELTNTTTARSNLGLGTIAVQQANNVSITGGSITGLNALSVTDSSDSQISVGVNDSASITAINNGTLTLTTANGNFQFNTTGGDYEFNNSDSTGRMYMFFTATSSNVSVLDITKSNGGSFALFEYLKSGTGSSTNDEVVINAKITSSDGTNAGSLKYLTTVSGSSQSGAWQFTAASGGVSKNLVRIMIGGIRIESSVSTKHVNILYAGTTGASYDIILPDAKPASSNSVALTEPDGTQVWSRLRCLVEDYNMPNVPATSFLDVTFTVPGAKNGQVAYVNRIGGFGDLLIAHSRVSADDTVIVRFYNPTGSAIDLATEDILFGLL